MRVPVLFALLALAAPSLPAQRLAALPAGTLVRIETSVHDVFIGPLLSADADTVRITTRGKAPPVVLPTANILGYAVGDGRDRVKGAWRGAQLGVGFGLLVWGVIESQQQSALGSTKQFARVFAITSSIAGISIGVAMAPERWIPLQNQGAQDTPRPR